VGIHPSNLVWICVAVVLATLGAGLYPAWRAGRVAPVETIKLV
jgi:ABC-type lipoprotein release transport system permease subunit